MGLEASAWSDRLELEVDNLRVALRWAQGEATQNLA